MTEADQRQVAGGCGSVAESAGGSTELLLGARALVCDHTAGWL